MVCEQDEFLSCTLMEKKTSNEETEKILLLYKHCAYCIKKRDISGDNVVDSFGIVDKNSCFGTCFGRLFERFASWCYFTHE